MKRARPPIRRSNEELWCGTILHALTQSGVKMYPYKTDAGRCINCPCGCQFDYKVETFNLCDKHRHLFWRLERQLAGFRHLCDQCHKLRNNRPYGCHNKEACFNIVLMCSDCGFDIWAKFGQRNPHREVAIACSLMCGAYVTIANPEQPVWCRDVA